MEPIGSHKASHVTDLWCAGNVPYTKEFAFSVMTTEPVPRAARAAALNMFLMVVRSFIV